MKYITGP